MLIDNVKSPEDIKGFSKEQLEKLAEEIRKGLMNRLSKKGGHFGPNFGFVEATIALHYVFNSPVDKFVFDVSHQSYVHKMLTGRKDAYFYDEHFADVSGYTNPEESEHDFFNVGHTSTSISLACGLAKGRDLKGDKENIVAVIGDGSLSGGEALEGLDFASELNSNFIIIVNDNDMSIAENHGGLYKNLKELRDSDGKCECNLFKAMGLDYRYVADGNNIESLIKAFEEVKDIDHPVVVHINTLTRLLLERLVENTDAYNLTPDDCYLISTASAFHDIGKVGIDESILNKPGKLTKEEFETMKEHTLIGASMLDKLEHYKDEKMIKIAYQICRWHHERYDGKGYPDGLTGEQIPIAAQVVSVADVYDALVSKRVYKDAYSHEQAMKMILNGECGAFNPRLMEVLVEIQDKIKEEMHYEV